MPSKKVQAMASANDADFPTRQQGNCSGKAKAKATKAQINTSAEANASQIANAMSQSQQTTARRQVPPSSSPELRSPLPKRPQLQITRQFPDVLDDAEWMELEEDPDADLPDENMFLQDDIQDPAPLPPPIRGITKDSHKRKGVPDESDDKDEDKDEEENGGENDDNDKE
ncbi:hypothetical protein FRC02_006018 [Tulasnella sp. 418]|nr:hypothetical protein FRC02_006018 [Tulasnella sp. 418]